jgi:gamma-glutamyltranspeptidase / glutathione hydrolase
MRGRRRPKEYRHRASRMAIVLVDPQPGLAQEPIASEGAALRSYGHTFTETAEIGAVTGIEFLDDGRTLAAAEPTRRGGGSAAVVHP